ncbi:methylglyoxal synthase [Halogeometricum borinquense]|uniref:Methylglyoxal synthase n=2 Tax=Halogeometricum borinquense TaxID=60847 RepID=E4NQV9_HALBP|nr:methylglyoxal synthase [Halogeometricum borinquense]ADQ67906.1 methylglyoxal synthase [Halogeometricum borinquense DSM 11551]ELY24174.1 methylglyoxal synthase [Halogeometricum borinquense DSM 11551]QIB73480.1 methylglyoxal synthase [Halogeometricum borinquense]QIQ77118.1 methylglyoxal synthase [Halogeometricum borinquense]RYJ08521.1 methylglyoxal synthase [Halogeometricum borinquense]
MRLALIAHDEKKPDLIEFAQNRQDDLEHLDLMATGTTGQRLIDATGLDIERKESGPLGGDMQIGAEIASETCHGVIFLRDPLTAQPHEPDITALLRICDVHDVPLATNLASADAVLDELLEQLGDEPSRNG